MKFKSFWDKITNWELWPFKLRYFGISPVWLWYCLRSRSMWFFTASNPTLTFGGFEGESKKEMYEQLPSGSYPETIYIQPYTAFEKVLNKVNEHKFTYPFVVKPDVGMAGILFRKIDNEQELRQYHLKMPVEYIVQEMITYPVEYSVFYYRYPTQQKGVITGFLQKNPMEVTGDGKSTLLQLILNHPKAKYRVEELQARHEKWLQQILPEGQRFFLSHAANLNRGASFVNLHAEIDERLLAVFDSINHYSRAFYYGRYDLKATSLDDLKNGKNFSILEFNGSGAEPNHIYNSGYTLRQAHKEILKHWKVLFEISRYNHGQGIRYWPFIEGWHFLKKSKKHFEELKRLDV